MNVDSESIKAAARLLHLAAFNRDDRTVFVGLQQEDGAYALVLALAAHTQEEMTSILDGLRQLVGDAVPSGAAHLEQLQERALAVN